MSATEQMQALIDEFGFPPGTTFDHLVDVETGETVADWLAINAV